MEEKPGTLLLSALVFGALWGLAEATVGFGLHLLSRLSSLPHLAGLFMFPIGLLFMVQAFRATGRAQAALLTAFVAAGLKLSSAALPGIGLVFVSNPALSILAEGLVSFLLLRYFSLEPQRALGPVLFASGLLWRALFLGLLVLLPVQKGILHKGPEALASFLLLDTLVNTVLIAAAASLWRGSRSRWLPALRGMLLRPAGAAAAVLAALGAETVLSLL